MKTANAAMEEILDEKYLNITELNHPIYAAATVITEEINGTGERKLQTQRSKTSPWVIDANRGAKMTLERNCQRWWK